MEIEMQTNETEQMNSSKTALEHSDVSEQNSSLPSSQNIKKSASAEILSEDTKAEQEKIKLEPKEDDFQSNKNLNIRDNPEISPFKQAVRGFVINKLQKKVGSSTILAGLTEKIVKKLEDNKDTSQPVLVHNSESDLSLSSLKSSEASTDIISSSLSCELKSVVANDLALLEALNVEDAIECVEEAKSLIDDVDIGINIPQKNEFRSNSISLPSSPAHCLIKRASSISYSLENVESTSKNMHSSNLSFLSEESKSNNEDFEKSEPREEIELVAIKRDDDNSIYEESINSEIIYPHNIYYSIKKEEKPKLREKILYTIISVFALLKSVMKSLSLSHFLLLASVIIHNIEPFSVYLSFIFDPIVIAYVSYSYICIVVQKSNFPLVEPQLENASIPIQKTNRLLECSVRILKGDYDPEMVKNHSTDLVDISIENCCLKIDAPKKKSKDVSINSDSFKSYDLLGAIISIVPKNLSRRRVWNKKYPICIVLPSKECEDCDVAESLAVDYLSLAKCENHVTKEKAVYLFTLTDREKETLFWVLRKNTESSDTIMHSKKPSEFSPKVDFSSMSYTSLLELNSDDGVSQNKDTEDESPAIVDDTNKDLVFENYMMNLFENFERMIKFSPRSRSFSDLSRLKDDSSKLSDSCISKDDTYLSHSAKEYSVDWLNVVLGRVFYDFLTQKRWSDEVKSRIQKKLDKIEMPSFIESLEVSEVFLGSSLPQVHTVSNPVADANGIWLNFDFNYCGSFQMTLKTKLKIVKGKQLPSSESMEATDGKQNVIVHSSESSDEEEEEEVKKIASTKQKKLINRLEKWISHKHFQTVAQSRFVKKYVGDLSNMPLTLTVEVNTLHGTLTLNVPPAPTDRIWYGFRKDPVLSLNAYPKVGTREINISAVVQTIEKKLVQEFKKALVMPNMDDLLIPVMYTPIYEL